MKHRSTAYWTGLSTAVGALTLCLFWLPYHVPSQPSLSDSFFFGFNNRVAWLLFLTLMGVLVLFGPAVSETPTAGKPLSRSTLRNALIGTFLASAAMYLLTRKLNGYEESIYLIDRLRLLLEGRVPYRDFEYAYGSGFLYVPALIARLFHLGAADAYGISYVLSSLLGTFLLYLCLLWTDGQPAPKRYIFLFLWAASLFSVLNFGVNYSWLRYDLPVFWILLIHREVAKKTRSSLVPFGLALLGYAPMLLDSPELAVAFAAGSALYLALAGRLRTAVNALGYAVMLLSLAGITALAARLDVFRTMVAFRMGGFNFPVIPAPHLLLFLFTAGVAACQSGTLLRTKGTGTALPLFSFGLFASAAALGRCDPAHVLMDGLPLFICAGVALSGLPLPWKSFVPVLWLMFLIIPLARNARAIVNTLGRAALPTVFAMEPGDRLSAFDVWILRRMKHQLGDGLALEKFTEYRAAAHREKNFSLDKLFGQPPGTIYEVPYGVSITHFGLYHSALVDEGYFFEMTNVVTPEQVERKVNELREHPERPLLLLAGREDACSLSVEGERAFISSLFLFPYRAKGVNTQSLSEPLCTYIHKHYQRTLPADAAHFGYALWRPIL